MIATVDTVDSRPGDYYVSVVDGDRYALVSGPYPTHTAACDHVEAARAIGDQLDPRSVFCGWGTCSMEPNSGRTGLLQRNGWSLDLERAT